MLGMEMLFPMLAKSLGLTPEMMEEKMSEFSLFLKNFTDTLEMIKTQNDEIIGLLKGKEDGPE